MRRMSEWTVIKLLEWSREYFAGRGIDSARVDAEHLLAHTLGIDRVRLYMEFDRPLLPAELDQYRDLVKRRARHEPVAYLTGTRGFWTLDLKTDPRALIPRPDTEVVVEEALKRLHDRKEPRVIDIGTGTGAIALAIASERPDATVIATDVSADALALAADNVIQCGLERVQLVQADLFEGIDGMFDLIVSNPPYVATNSEALADDVREYEPAGALFAGEDGLEIYRRLIPQAGRRLHQGGAIVVEIGYDLAEAVQALLHSASLQDIELRRDYGDVDRVLSARNGAPVA